MINPTSQQYISDLLQSNREDFGAINTLQRKAKDLSYKRSILEWCGDMSKDNMLKIADLSAKILLHYNAIQHLRRCINGRLDEIDRIKEARKHGA